jgi:hypothetical protein
MRFLTFTASLIVLAWFSVASAPKRENGRAAAERPGPSETPNNSAPVPVIVELFTSEGCSSCPPADALLAHLETEQSVKGAEILALEEHVDYWNGLGWVDPFSSREWTARQERYAEAFAHGSSYTPQMVVDGRYEFVGSRFADASKAISASAAGAKAAVTILRSGVASDGVASNGAAANGHQPWTITVDKLGAASAEPAEVWLAITETHLHSKADAGENAGHDLAHAAVVRHLSKIASVDGRKQESFSATSLLNFPANWKKENLRVVAFVQEKKSRHIVGAASAKVNP